MNFRENQKLLQSELNEAYEDFDNIFQGDDGLSASFQKYADKISEMRHQMTVIENVLQSAHVNFIVNIILSYKTNFLQM